MCHTVSPVDVLHCCLHARHNLHCAAQVPVLLGQLLSPAESHQGEVVSAVVMVIPGGAEGQVVRQLGTRVDLNIGFLQGFADLKKKHK